MLEKNGAVACVCDIASSPCVGVDCTTPRREAAQTHGISGIGHRRSRPIVGGKSRPGADTLGRGAIIMPSAGSPCQRTFRPNHSGASPGLQGLDRSLQEPNALSARSSCTRRFGSSNARLSFKVRAKSIGEPQLGQRGRVMIGGGECILSSPGMASLITERALPAK